MTRIELYHANGTLLDSYEITDDELAGKGLHEAALWCYVQAKTYDERALMLTAGTYPA